MTEHLYGGDAYARSCEAAVTAVDATGVELDQTVFYPRGGGQPGDTGRLTWAGGEAEIIDAIKGETAGSVVHVLAEGASPPPPGEKVTATLDWDRRHRLMRMHTCMHLLSAVLDYPVTGGQVGDGKGRLDFDIPEATLDKEDVTSRLNALVEADYGVDEEWITDDELAAQPDLVKTMSVKPPTGAGRVRLLRIGGDVDLQPCGGTHVKRTGEIGPVRVRKIEKKGRQNRRVSIELV
jgi:misacylated tRNA(Ala) deacylase